MKITTDTKVEIKPGEPHGGETGLVRQIHICPDLSDNHVPVVILDVYLLGDGHTVPFFLRQLIAIDQRSQFARMAA